MASTQSGGFMRIGLAHTGKTQLRMVSAAIGPAFVQETAEAAWAQWLAE